MNKLEEMWEALLAYLPQAKINGHGDSWEQMCNEKTPAAATFAYWDVMNSAYCDAADAADAAYAAAYSAAYAEGYAQKAIDQIMNLTEIRVNKWKN